MGVVGEQGLSYCFERLVVQVQVCAVVPWWWLVVRLCLHFLVESDRGRAVSCNLHLVFKADARTVTEQDLKNREVSRLISVKYKRLDTTQSRWNTYEKELYGLVRIVTNFGSLITAATAKYPPSSDTCKIGIWNDATTALAQFASLTIPAGQIDHLSAKARRFYSWADKCAGTISVSYTHLTLPTILLV